MFSQTLHLIAFNTSLAHSYYKICDQDSLEAVTYALQSPVSIKVWLHTFLDIYNYIYRTK